MNLKYASRAPARPYLKIDQARCGGAVVRFCNERVTPVMTNEPIQNAAAVVARRGRQCRTDRAAGRDRLCANPPGVAL